MGINNDKHRTVNMVGMPLKYHQTPLDILERTLVFQKSVFCPNDQL